MVTFKFVNLSMNTIGVMCRCSESLLLMLDNLNLDTPTENHIIRKVMNMAIRCTYYVFCHRNKLWNNPDSLGCPFFYDDIVFFMVCDIFVFCIYVVLLVFADSQFYATLTERCMMVC